MKVGLTIAGSDSGGGAGIQADLKTFEAYGVFGTTAITSITAQNTTGVRRVYDLPIEVIADQIDAVFDDFDVAAVKIGMLSNREIVGIVADRLRARAVGVPVVLDPVMVATSGDPLMRDGVVETMVAEIFPLARVVTPNADEAAILSSTKVTDVAEMRSAAAAIVALGARAVLVKGGHIRPSRNGARELVDLLLDGGAERLFSTGFIETTSTHGTGCTLASAIAGGLATGLALEEAVERAQDYVHGALENAPGLGRGHGPLLHSWRGALGIGTTDT